MAANGSRPWRTAFARGAQNTVDGNQQGPGGTQISRCFADYEPRPKQAHARVLMAPLPGIPAAVELDNKHTKFELFKQKNSQWPKCLQVKRTPVRVLMALGGGGGFSGLKAESCGLGAMSNGYRARIYPHDTGTWS